MARRKARPGRWLRFKPSAASKPNAMLSGTTPMVKLTVFCSDIQKMRSSSKRA